MVRVSKGLVLANIAVEPVIGKVPIGGDTKNPQPTLKLDVSLVDHLKQSWICLEVTPDNDGKLDEKMATSRVEVRQWGGPIKIDGPAGRTPLAMLLLVNNSWRVLQIAMFHFRYETVQTSNGPRRHFFS